MSETKCTNDGFVFTGKINKLIRVSKKIPFNIGDFVKIKDNPDIQNKYMNRIHWPEKDERILVIGIYMYYDPWGEFIEHFTGLYSIYEDGEYQTDTYSEFRIDDFERIDNNDQ